MLLERVDSEMIQNWDKEGKKIIVSPGQKLPPGITEDQLASIEGQACSIIPGAIAVLLYFITDDGLIYEDTPFFEKEGLTPEALILIQTILARD